MDKQPSRKIGYATVHPDGDLAQQIQTFRRGGPTVHPIHRLMCDFVFIDKIDRLSGKRPELRKMISMLRSNDDIFFNKITDISSQIKDIYYCITEISVLGCTVNFVDLESEKLFRSYYQGVGFLAATFKLEEMIAEAQKELMSARVPKPLGVKRGRPSKSDASTILELISLPTDQVTIKYIEDKYHVKRSKAYEIKRSVQIRRESPLSRPRSSLMGDAFIGADKKALSRK